MASVRNPATRPMRMPYASRSLRRARGGDPDELGDDVDQRTGGQRQERDADGLAGEPVPGERPDEGRAAADRAERQQEPQLGRGGPSSSTSAASGATMPKPSVALCRPKPITSITARAISPAAADCPIARPSAKLCRPMPTAISSERRRAADQRRDPAALRSPRMSSRRARTAAPAARPARHPALVEDQRQQPGGEAGHAIRP